ncbi:MAG TPA: single-stranded DNA-binding protein [Methanoregulaceae archaeon]|nr:single-stranded DNA-binding protein [Methanothrix sp.]HOK07774.1 single-stranded DNA-binding protein [Syntrophales bacterium]HON93782.1 single-stranded DNA-binding protein [Sedimentisphaerales bacterium]HPD11232.1 single-stranded DNA-binding protein [Methanoregulaceae archaeon]HRT52206.1 single-stranded DNA-binding protein [Anaerohalosphaeraceae bacterium]HOL44479.1 single-stranded DNA-binding protein [Methanothrix sp.]
MINRAILVGRLGQDPEVRYTPDGMSIANFTLATDEVRKDKNGERIKKTDWHRIVAFGNLADICTNYLAKGRLVYIEGRIQNRSYEDKDGIRRNVSEIIANTMQILDRKNGDGHDAHSAHAGGANREAVVPSKPGLPEWMDTAEIDDDVPF